MRDPKIEAWLDKLLVKWEYVKAISLNDIAFDSDSRNSNQIRFELIDEQNIHNLIESRRAGDEMPALLLNSVEDRTYILDGNHRYESAREVELKTHDAYMVSVDPGSDLELQLMLEPNTRLAAKQLEEEEALRWAIYLHTHYPKLKQADIARRVGLKPGQVSSAIAGHKAWIRAQKILRNDRQLFVSWQSMNSSVQRQLNRIPNDVGLKYSIEVVAGYQLSREQITRLVTAVSDSGTDEDAVACIDQFLEEETSKNTVKRDNHQKPAWDYLKMHAGAVRNVSSERVHRELMSGTLDNKQVTDLEKYLLDANKVIEDSLRVVSEYKASLGKLSPAKKVARTSAKR